jgi:hypothetical protein
MYFTSSLTFQPENFWFPSWTDQWPTFPNEPDAWYWDKFVKGFPEPLTRTYQIELPFPAGAGPDAVVTAEFSSKLSPIDINTGDEYPHETALAFPGLGVIAEGSWYGKRNVNISGTVPLALIADGANSIDVALTTKVATAGASELFLNRITVEYRRRLQSTADRLSFSDAEGGQRQFDLGGYSSDLPDEIFIWDISERRAPLAVDGDTVAVTGSGPFTYTFGTAHPAGASFYATTAAGLRAPASITEYVAPSLEPPSGAAEWLAVAHQDFITETGRLAGHRQEELYGGLTTHVVDVEDVINQYGFGLPIPAAIQDYLIHGLAEWELPPRYLTLVGDATINPKGNLNNGGNFTEPQLVLTDLAFVDASQGQIPSDLAFALVVGEDEAPDIAVGRLPAKTAADVTAMVDKIILYEENHLAPADWMRTMLFVADDTDSTGDFCLESQATVDHLPDALNSVLLCQADPDDWERVRTEMFTYTNELGITLLSFRGHGNLSFWATPNILTVNDVGNMTNSDRPIIMVSGECLDGYFAYPTVQGLGETFLRAPAAGSAAHWSSTGLGLPSEHTALMEDYFDALFVGGKSALGDTAVLAKIDYGAEGGSRALIYSFTLLGDPAMQLMRRALSLEKSAVQSQAGPGEEVDFVLRAANLGLYPSITTITDTLPVELHFITATSNLSTTVTQADSEIRIEVAYGPDATNAGLPLGAAAIVTLTVQVDPEVEGDSVVNQAYVWGTGLETNPGDESASAELPINNSPLAVDDQYVTDEETQLSVPAPGVLANDSDPESDPIVAVLQAEPENGEVALAADGSFVYTPALDFSGEDAFTYVSRDALSDSDPAIVTIVVNDVNNAPIANDDSYSSGSQGVLVGAPGVLGNDQDPDSDALTAALVQAPVHGTLTLTQDGSFGYVPLPGYAGLDTFVYRADDGRGGGDVAVVYIVVNTALYLPLVVQP